MEKAYSRIKWENYPSIATPLNETNLNKMDMSLDEVDNRVLGLDTAKLDKAVANTMVKDIAFNEKTGIFTITLLDGTTKTIDTKLEKVATNFSYDYETQKLVLTLVDGTEQEIDMSTLISQYEFADTSTIGFTVGNEGKITAIVKDGSITEAKLQPNFLANVKTEVSKAKSYADSSYENATTSRNAVTEAKQYRDEALQFRNEAESFAPEGYADLVEQVNENTVKVDTIIAKADLGIKETATGEEIHLIDSAEGKAVEFALYGKAKQNTTQGNQLFNANSLRIGNNDTLDISEDEYTITVSGGTSKSYSVSICDIDLDLIRGKTIYLNVDSITKSNSSAIGTVQIIITNADDTKNYFQYNGVAKAIEVPEDVKWCQLNIYSNNSSNLLTETNTTVAKGVRVSLEEDAEWEKFSGGMASPNPQYPQPIEVSGESGSVEVKSCGKNFIDYPDTTITTDFWLVGDVPNNYNPNVKGKKIRLSKGTYTLSFKSDVALKNSLAVSLVNVKGDRSLYTSSDVVIGYNEIIFTVEEEINSIVGFTSARGTFSEIQIEKGNKRTPFQPYKETLSTIPTENGLAGIKVSSNGNYTDQNGQQWICDEIVKYADGSGEHIQRVEKLSNTTFSIEKGCTLETSELFKCLAPNSYSKSDEPFRTIVCNKLPFSISVLSNDICGAYQGYEKIFARIPGVTTVEEINSIMGDSEFYYILAEPIRTPLTAEEIAEIEKLRTFYPVTNISNDFDCGMSVKYNCDSKNYIDNKIALLTTAMVNNI